MPETPPVQPRSNHVQQPPSTALRITLAQLETFTRQVLSQAGMPEDQVSRLTPLLVDNDLRGNNSHGTRQLERYVTSMQKGTLNATPKVRLAHETSNSLVMDGDGGLGYFPAYEGTLNVIEKAEQHGMAAMSCRNHGHIGAAGIYARMAVEHDLCAFVTSGVQLRIHPNAPVYWASGGSPMAFCAPTKNEPPLVLDCGVTHDIQGKAPPHRDALAAMTPGLVLRALGFGTICQSWGGLLAGLPVDATEIERTYPAANQGTFAFAFKVSLFADLDKFKEQMDQYARQVRQLTPVEGTEGAYLPGGVEAEREPIYREQGIPLGERHQEVLRIAAEATGVAVPWE